MNGSIDVLSVEIIARYAFTTETFGTPVKITDTDQLLYAYHSEARQCPTPIR